MRGRCADGKQQQVCRWSEEPGGRDTPVPLTHTQRHTDTGRTRTTNKNTREGNNTRHKRKQL